MDIYQTRDSKLSARKKIEIYKKSNIIDQVRYKDGIYAITLSFDENDYEGSGKTPAVALTLAEGKWRRATKGQKFNAFTRCWG